MVECFALLGHVLARNGRSWGFKLSVLAKPSLEAVQFNFTTKLLFKRNMKWAWLLSWVRFDTYPGGMLKHGIDSRSRVIFSSKGLYYFWFSWTACIPRNGVFILAIYKKSDHHMRIVAPINFDDQNSQFHMFEAIHTLSCSLHCALKARIKQMWFLCFLWV